MSQTHVRVSADGPIARVTLLTEGKPNILSTAVLTELDEVLQAFKEREDVRVCVFTGDGKVFAAGADIKEMSGFDVEGARAYGKFGSDVLDAIAALSCVTIAAINGAALGGGLELALACDLRYALRTARVGLPEVRLGLIQGWGGVRRLPPLVGPAHARRLILSGEAIKAEDGVPMGLIDEVVNSVEDLHPRVEVIARSFLSAGPQAIACAKRAMIDGDDVTAFADCFLESADGKEGMSAFIEKRKAGWVVE